MSVILLILKILGIIILSILTVLVLLILIPFFYRIHIKYTKDEEDYSFKLNTLLRFLYVVGNYDKDLNLCIRIIGIPIYRLGKYRKDYSDGSENTSTDSVIGDEELINEDEVFDDNEAITELITTAESENASDIEDDYRKSKVKKEKVPLKTKISNIKSKINGNNLEAVKHIARCIGRFIKRIKPCIVSADCDYSLGSPDTTGMSYGAICVLPSAHKKGIEIRPDFNSENTYFYGEVLLKGNFQIINAISLLVRILINKNCRKLIFGGK